MSGTAYAVKAPQIATPSVAEADALLISLAGSLPPSATAEPHTFAVAPTKGSIGEAIGTTTTLEGLRDLLVARRRELGLPQLLVDEISGLPSGYSAKIECGSKGLGKLSIPLMLGALGLELQVVRAVPHAERSTGKRVR